MSSIYYLIGVTGLLAAQFVASSLNPILRIAFLILVFLCGSLLMILLDFYFLGLTYIIVYVGAILILFLFVIMMVQIHLMPLALKNSLTPRVFRSEIGASTTASKLTSSGLFGSIFIATDSCDSVTDQSTTDQAITLPINFISPTATIGEESEVMALGEISDKEFIGRSLTLSNSLGRNLTIRSLVLFIQSLPIIVADMGQANSGMVVNYFFASWSIEFKTMTDLETLAHILYVGYPTALILVSVALWVVMIGIIKVTMSDR